MTEPRVRCAIIASTLLTAGRLASAGDDLVVSTPGTRHSEQRPRNFAGLLASRPRSDRGMVLRIYGPDAPNHDDPVVTVNPGDDLASIDWADVQRCAAHWLKKDDALQNGVVAGLCRVLVSARTDGWRAAGRAGDAPDVTP